MDLDQEVASLKARVANLESILEVAGAPVAPKPAHHLVRAHLEAGALDKAGALVGLDRAHAGDEEDDSYRRRLAAHIGDVDASTPVEAPQAGPEGEAGSDGSSDGEKPADAQT